MKYPATAVLALILAVTLTGCGPEKTESASSISHKYFLFIALLAASAVLVSALFVLGAVVYGSRRRLPWSANFEVYRGQS